MIEYVFRPIDKWPREFTKGGDAEPFKKLQDAAAILKKHHGE